MKLELNVKLEIEVKDCNFKSLTIKFLFALTDLFQQFVTQVLLYYFEKYYDNGKLKDILNIDNYRKKSTNTKTKFKTLFGDIWIPQIQIRTLSKDSKEHQLSISRILLGIIDLRR